MRSYIKKLKTVFHCSHGHKVSFNPTASQHCQKLSYTIVSIVAEKSRISRASTSACTCQVDRKKSLQNLSIKCNKSHRKTVRLWFQLKVVKIFIAAHRECDLSHSDGDSVFISRRSKWLVQKITICLRQQVTGLDLCKKLLNFITLQYTTGYSSTSEECIVEANVLMEIHISSLGQGTGQVHKYEKRYWNTEVNRNEGIVQNYP